MYKIQQFVFIIYIWFNIIPAFSQLPVDTSKLTAPSTIPPAVVINKYCNKPQAQRANEWVEFLVYADNTDISGWKFVDDNCSQGSFITNKTIFKAGSIWSNLRAGTVIVVWVGAPHTSQIFKKDGYIEVK